MVGEKVDFKLITESLEQIIKEKDKRKKEMKGDMIFLIEYAEKYIRRYTTESIKTRLNEIKQKVNSRFYENAVRGVRMSKRQPKECKICIHCGYIPDYDDFYCWSIEGLCTDVIEYCKENRCYEPGIDKLDVIEILGRKYKKNEKAVGDE